MANDHRDNGRAHQDENGNNGATTDTTARTGNNGGNGNGAHGHPTSGSGPD